MKHRCRIPASIQRLIAFTVIISLIAVAVTAAFPKTEPALSYGGAHDDIVVTAFDVLERHDPFAYKYYEYLGKSEHWGNSWDPAIREMQYVSYEKEADIRRNGLTGYSHDAPYIYAPNLDYADGYHDDFAGEGYSRGRWGDWIANIAEMARKSDYFADVEFVNVDWEADDPHSDPTWENSDSAHYWTTDLESYVIGHQYYTSFTHFIDIRACDLDIRSKFDDYDGYSYFEGSAMHNEWEIPEVELDFPWYVNWLLEDVDDAIQWALDTYNITTDLGANFYLHDFYVHAYGESWYRDCSPAVYRYSYPPRRGSVVDELRARFPQVSDEDDTSGSGMPYSVFPPVDNMARYWYEQFLTYRDPMDLGPLLHAVADASVPHHAAGCLGNWHGAYESYANRVLTESLPTHLNDITRIFEQWDQVDESPPSSLDVEDLIDQPVEDWPQPAINWPIDLLVTWLALNAYHVYKYDLEPAMPAIAASGDPFPAYDYRAQVIDLGYKATAMSALVLKKAYTEAVPKLEVHPSPHGGPEQWYTESFPRIELRYNDDPRLITNRGTDRYHRIRYYRIIYTRRPDTDFLHSENQGEDWYYWYPKGTDYQEGVVRGLELHRWFQKRYDYWVDDAFSIAYDSTFPSSEIGHLEDGTWYCHIVPEILPDFRMAGFEGVYAPTSHSGRINIDTTSPWPPYVSSNTHVFQDKAYADPNPVLEWVPSDEPRGVGETDTWGYHYRLLNHNILKLGLRSSGSSILPSRATTADIMEALSAFDDDQLAEFEDNDLFFEDELNSCSAYFNNLCDGRWHFLISAEDKLGNRGQEANVEGDRSEVTYFVLNIDYYREHWYGLVTEIEIDEGRFTLVGWDAVDWATLIPNYKIMNWLQKWEIRDRVGGMIHPSLSDWDQIDIHCDDRSVEVRASDQTRWWTPLTSIHDLREGNIVEVVLGGPEGGQLLADDIRLLLTSVSNALWRAKAPRVKHSIGVVTEILTDGIVLWDFDIEDYIVADWPTPGMGDLPGGEVGQVVTIVIRSMPGETPVVTGIVPIEDVTDRIEGYIQNAAAREVSTEEDAQQQVTDIQQFKALLEQNLATHSTYLEGMLVKAPAQVQRAIQQAILATKQGYQTAIGVADRNLDILLVK